MAHTIGPRCAGLKWTIVAGPAGEVGKRTVQLALWGRVGDLGSRWPGEARRGEKVNLGHVIDR